MSAVESALATPGLGWLVGASLVAGMVRGFSGFGTALIFMPVAMSVVPPFWALTILVVMDFLGPLPSVPRALRIAGRAELTRLAAGMILGLPVGIALLSLLPVAALRWIVSGLVLAVLALLVSGWRHQGRRGPRLSFGAGGLSGFLGGATGLSGPPVILYYMTSRLPAAVLRANLLVYFVALDLAFLGWLGLFGRVDGAAVALGIGLAAPFLFASLLGAAMFRPERERLYRWTAYALIAAAALAGLPIWG